MIMTAVSVLAAACCAAVAVWNIVQRGKLVQYGYKPTAQDAANTGYTLAQLNAMYNSIKNAMRSGLYG